MLTKTQKKVYDYIALYLNREGIAPTLAEIGQGIGINSKGTVSRYVQHLIELKLIKKNRAKGASRNLALNESKQNQSSLANIPLVGTIAAGKPIEAVEASHDGNLQNFIYGDDLFMLKVKGSSMIEEGIFDGDYVICDKTNTAGNGDIVVALIDNADATLKRIYWQTNGTVLLCPANSDMTPLELKAEQVQIQGILRCQLRRFNH